MYWLPVKAGIKFKICLLAFKALKYDEPRYHADLLNLQNVHVGMSLRTSDDPSRLEVPKATSERYSLREHFRILPLAF